MLSFVGEAHAFFRSSVSLLNPSAVFIYLITVRSCGRSIQFSHGTVRNGVKIIPVVFDLLPSGFHAGIDINEKPAVLLMVKEKTGFCVSVSAKGIPGPVDHFPCGLFIYSAVFSCFYGACGKCSICILKLPLRWIAGFLNPMTIVCSVSGYNSRYRIYISFFRIKDCVAGYRGAGAAYRGSGTGRAVRIAIIRDRRNFRYVFIVYSNCRRGRLAAGRYRNYSLTGTQTGYKTIFIYRGCRGIGACPAGSEACWCDFCM